MESVLDVLKTLGKATFKQVAAQLRIEPIEALNMLREQREIGKCDHREGFWILTGTTGTPAKSQTQPPKLALPAKPKKPATAVTPKRNEEPAPVDPQTITQLLQQNGAMTTLALATAVNRGGRGMVSVMRSLESQGIVVKNGEGKGVTWSLPAAAAEPKDETPAATLPVPATGAAAQPEAAQQKTTAELIQDIPAFAPHPDAMAMPTPAGLAREIRRTETRLASLKKLRGAVRELHRHKHLLGSLQ